MKWRRSCRLERRKKKIVPQHVSRTNWTFTNSFDEFIENKNKTEFLLLVKLKRVAVCNYRNRAADLNWKKERRVTLNILPNDLLARVTQWLYWMQSMLCFFFLTNKTNKRTWIRSSWVYVAATCVRPESSETERCLHQRTLWHRFPVNHTTIYD